MELTLVSFAPEEVSEGLRHRLDELGYRIHAVDGEAWLHHVVPQKSAPAVLAFGTTDYPRERLLAALNHPFGPASLGVFHDRAAPWDRQLLASCHEFVGWPCAGDELKYRLERLYSSTRRTATNDAAENFKEFVDLNLIGQSRAFLEALATIKKLARCEAPVLIEGETGTGKELVARAIHYLGVRRDCPFIPVNCGAIPDNLIENELFGHERGAFTDAREAREGVIAQAEGGTLFLDEVDTLSTKAQVALLRFLQDRHYRPLGAKRLHQANVRIVAAVNVDLSKHVECGRFRADLMYRLKVVSFRLPPLRERMGDVALLTEHFLHRLSVQYGRPMPQLSAQALEWLAGEQWPGNVRELESFIHREFILAEAGPLVLSAAARHANRRELFDRRRPIGFGSGLRYAKNRVVAEFEKSFLCSSLAQHGGNITAAAKHAGKERRAFGKLLMKYGIDAASYRAADSK